MAGLLNLLLGFSAMLFTPAPAFADAADLDFAARCAGPGVVRCVDFDSNAWVPDHNPCPSALNAVQCTTKPSHDDGYNFGVSPNWDNLKIPVIDTGVKASGAGSMRMTFPAGGGTGSAGSWFTNFSADNSFQLSAGQEVWIQYRVRYDDAMLNRNNFPGNSSNLPGFSNGFKTADISFGDTPSCAPPGGNSNTCASSCPTSPNGGTTIVTQVNSWEGWTSSGGRPVFQMYANCSGNFAYLGMTGVGYYRQNVTRCPYPGPWNEPPCVAWHPNEWMTVKYHIKIGTWNSWSSTIQAWVAREGQPSVLVIDCSPTATNKCSNNGGSTVDGWWLENDQPNVWRLGKVWLHPYQTNLINAVGGGSVWYDELIISRQNIADPGVRTPTTTPSSPTSLRVSGLSAVQLPKSLSGVALAVMTLALLARSRLGRSRIECRLRRYFGERHIGDSRQDSEP
jgi:hypothetical protein